MNDNQKTNEVLKYSTLDVARKHLENSKNLTTLSMALPLPLICGAVLGFFYFQPTWYTDPFLWAILALFVFGQLGALVQYISLRAGAAKAQKTLSVVKGQGDSPDLQTLQQKMFMDAPPCQIRDGILRWIQLGVQGETRGMERMMDHAAVRRDQVANKIISFHSTVNRTTLKLGFLGTLIGLLMTFEPMKQAMLSLQGSQGEFKFINDIVKAIDGDAYAILTTLFATGLSIFIELLTIQVFDRILGQFEMVNNNLDDWCLIHLQPRIKDNALASEKKHMEELARLQKEFTEKITAIHNSMDMQLKELASRVEETGRQMVKLIPLEKEMGRKIALLTEYEAQYRQVLGAKLQTLAPTGLVKEPKNG
ncbi:MAG: hypothetical protein ACLFQB_15215 [Chitinispirillaceae bacterium]